MKIEKLSYEEALEELKKSLEELEKEDITLEDSLKTFKESVKLYEHCDKLIRDIEGEVKVLLSSSELEEDFDLED